MVSQQECSTPDQSQLKDRDLNGDGVSLLMAYALNLDPNQQLGKSLPKAKLNADTISLSYYSVSAGVTYRVETSKDLITWVTTGITITDPEVDPEYVDYPHRDPNYDGISTASVPRDEACGFLRLVIVED